MKVADDEYAGEVKQMDHDFVDNLRIPEDATDIQIQAKLKHRTILVNSRPRKTNLYNKFWQYSL